MAKCIEHIFEQAITIAQDYHMGVGTQVNGNTPPSRISWLSQFFQLFRQKTFTFTRWHHHVV